MIIQCSLCSWEFSTEEGEVCASCPMAGSCNMIRCPNCGYEFPDPSKGLSGWFRAKLEQHRRKKEKKKEVHQNGTQS